MPARTGERVDWVFGTGSGDAVDRAHAAVVDHLRRHAADAGVVEGATETLRTRLTDAMGPAAGRPLHVILRWFTTEAHLDLVRDYLVAYDAWRLHRAGRLTREETLEICRAIPWSGSPEDG